MHRELQVNWFIYEVGSLPTKSTSYLKRHLRLQEASLRDTQVVDGGG